MIELDRFLPYAHWQTQHAQVIPAPTDITKRAFADLTVGELKLTAVLFGLRMLPSLLFQPGTGSFTGRNVPVWDTMIGMGFVALDSIENGSATLGFIGQPWRMRLNEAVRLDIHADQFTDFCEPNCIKGLTGVVIRPHPRGSIMLTETRVFATDTVAKRRFQTYWRLIHPFSNLIRRDMLRGVMRRALVTSGNPVTVTKF